MGDDLLSEEELLAHAIALSLESQPPGRDATAESAGAGLRRREGVSPGASATAPSGPEVRYDAPLRFDTSQSYDSVLNEAEDSLSSSLTWQKQASQGQSSSQRSSPDDLGIAPDADPQNGTLSVRRSDQDYKKSSQDSLMSSPESERTHPHTLQNITLDGRNSMSSENVSVHRNPIGEESHQLPFTRLSSLHDMNLGEMGGASRKEWVPNKDALELIVGMGISENAAKRGLYNTGNDNAELAVAWVFENISDPELHQPFLPPVLTESPARGGVMGFGAVYHSYDEITGLMSESERGAEYKMVLVANTSLRMGVGKLAAQVGHAVLGLYHCLEVQHDHKPGLMEWEGRGAKKVILKGNDTQHLLDLKQKALELQIANILIHDAGRTQVDPGSLTILALFGQSKDLDCVTGKLKLL